MSPHRSPGPRDERPPAPDPLPIPVVDNHVHLDLARDGEQAPAPGEAIAAAASGSPCVVKTVRGADVKPESQRSTVFQSACAENSETCSI